MADKIIEKIDDKFINRLAQIMESRGLTKISIKQNDCEIELKRELASQGNVLYQMPQQTMMNAPQAPTTIAPPASEAVVSAPINEGKPVLSPVVGTAYLSAKPGEPNYVKLGDSVIEGQILMIVEAMKVMNPIIAPNAGIIAGILVENEDPVEFGQPLVMIK